MRLLVADDNRDSATTTADILRGIQGVELVDVACDGEEAVILALRRMPALAVLDVEMPRLGGVDAATTIRLAASGAPLVLVAVSGNPDSVAAAQASGVFDFVFGKPIPWQTLELIVRAATAATGGSLPAGRR